MISADVAYPPSADWLRRTMVPTLRRFPDTATWMSLRAGAALIGERVGLAAEVGRRLLDSPVTPRIAMYSPSGQSVSKAICFLFREGEDEPRIVVKAMAEPRFDWRLRKEAAVMETIRDRVKGDEGVTSALPPQPLLADASAGEFVVAEPFDPVGVAAGSGTREQAFEWLRAFQLASSPGERPWDGADEAVAAVRQAWRLAGRAKEDAVVARVRALLAPVATATVPLCAVHGDFWRENVAVRDGRVRVYDWEWAAVEGSPLFDLWTYELAELRLLARSGAESLDDHLAAALERVRTELRLRRLDDGLALATLAPVLGALSFRIRTRLDMPDEMERHSLPVMASAERLLEIEP